MVVSSSILSQTQTLNSDWQWCDWEGLPYLTCSLLQQWQHGFFTARFYPRLPEELVTILNPEATVNRVRQIHGNQIFTPTEIETAKIAMNLPSVQAEGLCSEVNSEPSTSRPPMIGADSSLPNSLPGADGILSDRSGQSVWVASADCSPILIGDVVTGVVAAIHAGWRGTAQKIVPNAIARFTANGTVLKNLRIAIGPAISGIVYQVTEEVAAEVGKSIITSETAQTTAAILIALQQLPQSPILEDPQQDRVRLDVRRVNAIQLQQLGIESEQIAIAPYCTYQQPNLFFSYRRTNEKQVQWSGIVSR